GAGRPRGGWGGGRRVHCRDRSARGPRGGARAAAGVRDIRAGLSRRRRVRHRPRAGGRVARAASCRPSSAHGGDFMNRPIRILELRSVWGTGGGPEKTILLGTARTDPRRFDVTVCYLRDRRDPIFSV